MTPSPDAETPVSPYLTGLWAPVDDEFDAAALPVTGEIPAALRGSYLRNGPNPQFEPLGRYHLFDGDGMVHSVDLADGTARYRNRWVESRGLLAERRAGRALFGGLSEFAMPEASVVEDAGFMKNTANTNVVRHAGRTLALMEAAPPTELGDDLATIGEFSFDGRLSGAMTAHPKWDPISGELLFFGYSPVAPFLTYHVADATGSLTRSVPIDMPASVMMHDFATTASHAVFFDLPAAFDLDAMFSGGPMIRWAPELGARIGVLPRSATTGSEIRWFEIDPCYVFHFLNASEPDDNTIVVDGCRAPELPITFGDEALNAPVRPVLHRWHIDLAAGDVREEQIDDHWGDFPRIRMDRTGLPNRYGYLAHDPRWGESVEFDSVVKLDLDRNSTSVHCYGAGMVAGEPVFAADPEGSAEDDGWLLNIVTDRTDETSALVILDARDMAADPVATVHLPRRVPNGFHGNWMPLPET